MGMADGNDGNEMNAVHHNVNDDDDDIKVEKEDIDGQTASAMKASGLAPSIKARTAVTSDVVGTDCWWRSQDAELIESKHWILWYDHTFCVSESLIFLWFSPWSDTVKVEMVNLAGTTWRDDFESAALIKGWYSSVLVLR